MSSIPGGAYPFHPPLRLEALLRERAEYACKGIPIALLGCPVGQMGAARACLLDEGAQFPVAVLKASALAANSVWMRGFLERTGTRLAPHGKTSMAPQLFDRQLRDGAWGITAATVAHLRVYRQHGVQRVMFANQLVGAAEIDYVLDELAADPAFDFYCLVDSEAALSRLLARIGLRPPGRPLQVLLEVGAMGGRTGVRGFERACELGRVIRAAAPAIALRGIETFEGIHGGHDMAVVEPLVAGLLALTAEVARAGERESWFSAGPVVLSAGGSAFFDMAARVLDNSGLANEVEVVLRSGCYLTHDSLHYARHAAAMRARMPSLEDLPGCLQPALELIAHVQSLPEPGRAIAGFGKRDASFDIDLPQPRWWFRPGLHDRPQALAGGIAVTGLNDQHAFVDGAAVAALAVGDLMGFGISHPCTTFDKWRLLPVVDDDYRMVDAIRTFF